MDGRLRGLYGIAGPDPATPRGERLGLTVTRARAFLEAGVRVLQLRDKEADGRLLLEEARALRTLTREAGALFVVNDRLDVALLAEADGVHVGQDDLPVDAVRLVAARGGRPELLVGLSTHTLEHVRAAVAVAPDYLGFGPVFGTTSKDSAYAMRGVPLLAEAVRAARPLPVVAIGGITLERAADVRKAGAAMAAVIGDVVHAAVPVERARALRAVLGG